MSARHVSVDLLNLSKVFTSLSPLPYNLGSPYLVHTLIIEVQAYVTLPSPNFHGLITLLNYVLVIGQVSTT